MSVSNTKKNKEVGKKIKVALKKILFQERRKQLFSYFKYLPIFLLKVEEIFRAGSRERVGGIRMR